MPELTTYFQAGGLVDGVSIRDCRLPSIFRSVEWTWMALMHWPRTGRQKIKAMPNVSGVYIPQD
jgi:UDP-N-acetyl-D-mannosaminuronic acid transferase (WecB/TagA/CpsF family)